MFYKFRVYGNPVLSDDGWHFLESIFKLRCVLFFFFRHNAVTRLVDYSMV